MVGEVEGGKTGKQEERKERERTCNKVQGIPKIRDGGNANTPIHWTA